MTRRAEKQITVPATAGATGGDTLPVELGPLRGYILKVAREVLDEDQCAAVLLVLEGKNQVEVAAELGWHKTKVTRVLHGASGASRSKRKSAVDALVAALKQDHTFRALHEETQRAAEAAAEALPVDAVVTDWFNGTIMPPRPDMVVPLSVLLVASRLADKGKRQLLLDDLVGHFPRAVINFSLQPLQVGGFIRFDGRQITILKVPVEEPARAEATIDPFTLTILSALAARGAA